MMTITVRIAAQQEDCTDCDSGSGPCFVMVNGAKRCLGLANGLDRCFSGTELCVTTTTIAPPSTAPTIDPPQPCNSCQFGTTGPCKHEISGYCLPLEFPNRLQCLPTTSMCVEPSTTQSPEETTCIQCIFDDGPCIHVPSGLCLAYSPGTSECARATVERNCPESTESTSSTTTQAPQDLGTDPTAHVYAVIHTGALQGQVGLRFSAVNNSIERLFSTPNLPDNLCFRMCSVDAECVGVYIEHSQRTRLCVGVTNVVDSESTTEVGISYAKTLFSTTTTTTSTISTRTTTTTTTSSTTVTSTTVLPQRFMYTLKFSSDNDSTGARFSTAFDSSSELFTFFGDTEEIVQQECETECTAIYDCAGIFVWNRDTRTGVQNATFGCRGLQSLGGGPRLIDSASTSFARERLCDRCNFGYEGTCRHNPTGFCMGTKPNQTECLPDFEQCVAIPPETETPTISRPTSAPSSSHPTIAPTITPRCARVEQPPICSRFNVDNCNVQTVFNTCQALCDSCPGSESPTISEPTSVPTVAPVSSNPTAGPVTSIPSTAPTETGISPTSSPIGTCNGVPDNELCSSFDPEEDCALGLDQVCPVACDSCP